MMTLFVGTCKKVVCFVKALSYTYEGHKLSRSLKSLSGRASHGSLYENGCNGGMLDDTEQYVSGASSTRTHYQCDDKVAKGKIWALI